MGNNMPVTGMSLSIQNYKIRFQAYYFEDFASLICLICWVFPKKEILRFHCITGVQFQFCYYIDIDIHTIKQTNALIQLYTGCPRRNVPDFGRVFLMLKYTDITQNTYIQSWTVTEIMAREVWNFDIRYTLIDYQIHIKTGRNMLFL